MGSPYGIVALIMGIIAMATFWVLGYWSIGISIITAILSIIFGGIGIGKDDSKAMAIIGLVFGIIVLGIIMFGLYYFFCFFF